MLKALLKYVTQVILNIWLCGAVQEGIDNLDHFDFNKFLEGKGPGRIRGNRQNGEIRGNFCVPSQTQYSPSTMIFAHGINQLFRIFFRISNVMLYYIDVKSWYYIHLS